MSTGELRAFVAARLGGHSWVVDLVPNYELTIELFRRAIEILVSILGP